MPKPSSSHTAFVLRRESRTTARWLEIGTARIEKDGITGAHYVYLDRLPIGGFGGRILLQPNGTRPPDQVTPTEDEDSDA